ncbi:MAG TPA: transposase [Chloroflexota bacterium]|nr:transposase [Chloroflexota bacterium]
MAKASVPPKRGADQLRRLLASPEVSALIVELDGTRWTGRPGYPIRTMVGMTLVKSLYVLPTWTRTVRLVGEHAALRKAIGGAPSVDACYRFTRKLREHRGALDACIAAVIGSLHAALPEYGQHVAIDGSDLPAYANGQRFVSKGGKLRERFSDPDASWGHRSAVSTRKGGGFYGYKVHAAVCTATDLPVAWETHTARDAEAPVVPALLDKLTGYGITPTVCIADKGYDASSFYEACEARNVRPVAPLRMTGKVVGGEHLPRRAGTVGGPSPVPTPSVERPSTAAPLASALRPACGSRLTGCTPSFRGRRHAGRLSTAAVVPLSASSVG